MIKFLLLILFFNPLTQDNGFDEYYNLINAYELKYNEGHLFSDLVNFTKTYGFPESLKLGDNFYSCTDRQTLNSIIKKSNNFIPIAKYGSLSFMIVGGDYVVPSLIDLRDENIKIYLDVICFSSNYLIDNFKNDFPKSFSNPQTKNSFFQSHKIDTGKSKINSFFLTKWSIDDKNSRQLIEFVFVDDKLGFIVFNNF